MRNGQIGGGGLRTRWRRWFTGGGLRIRWRRLLFDRLQRAVEGAGSCSVREREIKGRRQERERREKDGRGGPAVGAAVVAVVTPHVIKPLLLS